MRRIGIDQQFNDIYQDAGIYWRIILPAPILCDALLDPFLPVEFPSGPPLPSFIFREDDFDPTARLRRGRFYQKANLPQPSSQGVLPRTVEDYQHAPRPIDLLVFDQYQLSSYAQPPKTVALGSAESLWEVVSRPERITSGELLFILKARHSFGILPEVAAAAIPEEGRNKVIETLDTLKDTAYRESPGSVIDRARDATQWCLAIWAASKFGEKRLLQEDLAPSSEK